MTELKRAEEALHDSQEQLRRAQRLESVGRLAGGVAHDFNNLLTVVTACVDMLEGHFDGDAELPQMTRPIKAAAERGATLTRQLLAFARKQVVQPRVVDPNERVREGHELLQRLIGEDVELDLELAGDAWTIKIDPGQLEQVLVNLAINARDAMPSGGRLTIESRNVRLTGPSRTIGRSVPDGDWVLITVDDTGTGISAEALPFIFEPFFTTKAPGEGTGLGLATCFGIVRQAGGSIEVDSRPGQGTRFHVLLPRSDAPALAPSRLPEPPQMAEGHGTVLLVEDDPMVRHVTQTTLRAAGYDLVEAENGQEAIQRFHEHGGEIDLLITGRRDAQDERHRARARAARGEARPARALRVRLLDRARQPARAAGGADAAAAEALLGQDAHEQDPRARPRAPLGAAVAPGLRPVRTRAARERRAPRPCPGPGCWQGSRAAAGRA